LSVAVVSMIVLVIVGALGGLLFFRTFGGAVARNENQPVGEDDEAGNPQGNLREETRQSIWFFLGVGASVSAILIDVAGVATAFSGAQEFLNDAVPIAFLALVLATVGYFLGARMLAAGAIVFTVIALALAAAVIQWL
jgi:hypothetical protein